MFHWLRLRLLAGRSPLVRPMYPGSNAYHQVLGEGRRGPIPSRL